MPPPLDSGVSESIIGRMSLYWLCYRVDGAFNGLVLLEAETELSAQMRAELEDLRPGGDCESYEIGHTEASIIPSEYVGVLLGSDRVAELQKAVLAHTPKRPPALSIAAENPAHRERVND